MCETRRNKMGAMNQPAMDVRADVTNATVSELVITCPAAVRLPAPKRRAVIAWVPTEIAESDPPMAHMRMSATSSAACAGTDS